MLVTTAHRCILTIRAPQKYCQSLSFISDKLSFSGVLSPSSPRTFKSVRGDAVQGVMLLVSDLCCDFVGQFVHVRAKLCGPFLVIYFIYATMIFRIRNNLAACVYPIRLIISPCTPCTVLSFSYIILPRTHSASQQGALQPSDTWQGKEEIFLKTSPFYLFQMVSCAPPLRDCCASYRPSSET